MNDDAGNRVFFLAIIAGRKNRDALLTALHGLGIRLINTVYGKGTVSASFLRSTFGLVPEENKVFITCISTSVKVDAALRMLEEKFHFNKPNTGIAFTVPADKVSY